MLVLNAPGVAGRRNRLGAGLVEVKGKEVAGRVHGV